MSISSNQHHHPQHQQEHHHPFLTQERGAYFVMALPLGSYACLI